MTPFTPDFCSACDAANNPFALIQRETEQDFRSETFRVTTPALQSRHCDFSMLDRGNLDSLRSATHELLLNITSHFFHGEFILPAVSFTDVKPTVEQRATRGASSKLEANEDDFKHIVGLDLINPFAIMP